MISTKIISQKITIKPVEDEIYFKELLELLEKKKNELGTLTDKIGEDVYYHQYRKKYDIGVKIMYHIKSNNIGQNLTNAGIKLLEIMNYYNMKPKHAFFNAELPGSFIFATNYYTKGKIDWIASSYVPNNDNTALDDKFGLWKKYPEKWLMNEKFNGDITDLKNLEWIQEYFITHDKVDFYTSDIGTVIDYTKDPEIEMAQLDLMQAIYGLISLDKGGSMILKQFSFFHKFNIALIAIYASMFEQFYVCKPSTSRPINSETYLIGIGFNGLTININDILQHFSNIKALCDCIPNGIFDSLQTLTNQQIHHLNELNKFISTRQMNKSYVKNNDSLVDYYIKNYLTYTQKKSEYL